MSEFKQIYGQKELRDPGAELLFIANNEPVKLNKSWWLTLPSVNLLNSCSSCWNYILDATGPWSANLLDLGEKKGRDGEERGKITHLVVVYYLECLF